MSECEPWVRAIGRQYLNVCSNRTPLEPNGQKVHHNGDCNNNRLVMKPLPLLFLMLVFAACADIPELEGSESPTVRKSTFPRLIPLSEALGPPVDPVSEAAEVEEDLNARAEALANKAQALQNAEID